MSSTKTVVVLGGSYGGARAARILADELPKGWRVVVIERNSHMNHVYVFPRFVVLPEHAPKGFIPYTRIFDSDSPAPQQFNGTTSPSNSTPNGTSHSSDKEPPERRNIVIQGLVTSISPTSVTYLTPSPSYDKVTDSGHLIHPDHSSHHTPSRGVEEHTLPFNYLIYALGATLPSPCDVWGPPAALSPGRGSKSGGIGWMQEHHTLLSSVQSVAIVGGGALGIQFATDIKERWPEKEVTLVHSRRTLMPIYEGLHDVVMRRLGELGVEVVLGERVVEWPDDGKMGEEGDGATTEGEKKHGEEDGGEKGGKTQRTLKTAGGRTISADLVLACTGQRPRVALLEHLANVDPISGRIRVKPSLQIEPLGPAVDTAATSTPPHPSQLSDPASIPLNTASASAANPGDKSTANGGEARELASEMSRLNVDEEGETASQRNLGHIFAIGDCAHTSAIQAGHTAHYMGEVAARNIVRMIEAAAGSGCASSQAEVEPKADLGSTASKAAPNGTADGAQPSDAGQAGPELETYTPGAPAIKLTLGLKEYATHAGGQLTEGSDGAEDLGARLMWAPLRAESLGDDA